MTDPDMDNGGALVALGLLLLAAGAHFALRRLGRRLPVAIERRRTGVARPPAWTRSFERALLPLKAAAWIGAGIAASDRLPLLRMLRDGFERALAMSVTAPLFSYGDRGYSALDLVLLPTLLVALWLGVGAITRWLGTRVLGASGGSASGQGGIETIARGVLTFLGALLVLQAFGIDVRSLAILASVLGVGIGFGLQHIANNVVSGVLIGLERPIQAGDFVQVGGFTGTVRRVGARSTEILTLDRVTILVPNSKFLENEVVNWTHGDPVARIHVPVGVAYGSDLRRVRAALLEAARGEPEVLPEPPPEVEMRGFGESSLELELLVWTRDPRGQNALRSRLHFRIERCLARHRVQVPFPQRDLHLRSPGLEALARGFARERFGDAAPDAREAEAAALPPLPPEPEEEARPRAWTDEELLALAARSRGPDGVEISDRRHLFSVYPRCFVGRDAVDWLVARAGLGRDEAVRVGRLWIERGFVRHVLDEHGFHDGRFFYRFREDEPGA